MILQAYRQASEFFIAMCAVARVIKRNHAMRFVTLAKWVFRAHKLAALCVIKSCLIMSCQAMAQQSLEIEVPLVINQAFSGDISAQITNITEGEQTQTLVSVPISRLVELASQFANEEQLEQWLTNEVYVDSETSVELIALQTLRDRGLDIAFDSGLLTVVAQIPRLGTQYLSVRGRRAPVPDDHFSQARFASGLNIVVRNSFNHKSSLDRPSGFGDTNVEFSGFTTIGGFSGWSLFYEFDVSESRGNREFSRRDVTLTHDDFSRSLRYSFGDIRPTVSQFQGGARLFGFNLERNYSEINPFKNLRPSGRSGFTLERPSTVSFEVNGAIVDTADLEPGTYSISDFPLASGANDVRVLIDDGTSRYEAANFSTYVDTTLLAGGVTNFGVSVGFERQTGGGSGVEYSDDPVVLGFYEKGITSNLTLGAHIELAEEHALFAGTAIYGTRYGVFALNAATSNQEEFGTGYNSLLQYNLETEMFKGWRLRADAQASFQSDTYISLGQSEPIGEETAFNSRFSLTKDGLGFTLGGGIREVDDMITEQFGINISKSFRSFGLSLGYQYVNTERANNQTDSDSRINLTFSKRLGESRLQAGYNSASNEFSSQWRGKPRRKLGAINTSFKSTVSDEVDQNEFDLDYLHSRFEFDARYSDSSFNGDDRIDFASTSLTLSGAVGFADGSFAFGRPFRSGFAVVGRHKNLRGKKLSVSRNTTRGRKITTAKRRSTTLVPVDSSYRAQSIAFEVADLPLGYDVGDSQVKLFPGNLAGYRIDIGSDAANTVLGNLFWPDGTGVSLKVGKLISKDGEPAVIFTNRTGRFAAEKLEHGEYEVIFGDNDEFRARFEVPELPEPGLVRLDAITLEEKE